MPGTVGDTMRATIDGKLVAFIQSPGIAHPAKSKGEFGCMGKGGFFDNLSRCGTRLQSNRKDAGRVRKSDKPVPLPIPAIPALR